MIRPANISDLPAIVSIYNQAVSHGFQTADTEPVTVEERTEWFDKFNARYPLLVYTINEVPVGWASISPYRRGRQALRFCVELSYYVDKNNLGKGIGKALIQHALAASETLGYRSVISIILDKNLPSIRLIQKLGFQQWGHLPGIADFDGVECGHVYYGIRL